MEQETEIPNINIRKKNRLTREQECQLFQKIKQGKEAQKQVNKEGFSEEERSVLEHIIQEGQEAKNSIFLSYLWITDRVKYISVKNRACTIEDLKEEAAVKLLECINFYDPGREATFMTFAKKCIDGHINDVIAENDTVLTVKKEHQKNLWKIEKFTSDYYKVNGKQANIRDIMKHMGITETKARNLLGKSYTMLSYEGQLENMGSENPSSEDKLVIFNQKSCPEETLERLVDHDLVNTVDSLNCGGVLYEQVQKQLQEILMQTCSDTERVVIHLRFGFAGDPCTDQEIADKLGIDRIMVEQIWAGALLKLETPCRNLGLQNILS